MAADNPIVFVPLSKHPKFQDMTGRQFGIVHVLGYAGGHAQGFKGGSQWWCQCECGSVKRYGGCDLRMNKIKTCGCIPSGLKHGHARRGDMSAEYRIWHGIKDRCCNRNKKAFVRYGGRGIKVCQRWLDSFDNFLADMGPRPSNKYEIDRRNNDGDYEPSNCRWATRQEQCRNTSANHLITFQGETLCVTEWAERLGIRVETIKSRIKLLGWSVERALTESVRPRAARRTEVPNSELSQ